MKKWITGNFSWVRNLGLALVIVFIWIAGKPLIENWVGNWFSPGNEAAVSLPNRNYAPITINQICDGRKKPYYFGLIKPVDPVNAAGQCHVDVWYEGPGIYATVAGKSTPILVHPKENIPKDVEFLWSAGEPMNGYVILSPPTYR